MRNFISVVFQCVCVCVLPRMNDDNEAWIRNSFHLADENHKNREARCRAVVKTKNINKTSCNFRTHRTDNLAHVETSHVCAVCVYPDRTATATAHTKTLLVIIFIIIIKTFKVEAIEARIHHHQTSEIAVMKNERKWDTRWNDCHEEIAG